MKIKVTPSLPEADLVLMRHQMAKAVARIRLHKGFFHDPVTQRVDRTDLLESLGLQATIEKQLTDAYRSAAVYAMKAIHDCEFAAGEEPLLGDDIACLIDAEVARWRGEILGVDEGVIRATGIECTRFDYACRWN